MAARRIPRRKLDTDIKAAMALILEDYQGFLALAPDREDEKRSKAFASRHAAGRIALAHLQDLLNLGDEEAAEATVQAASRYLSEWRTRLALPDDMEPEPEGGGA
jgi:hypothetical protein